MKKSWTAIITLSSAAFLVLVFALLVFLGYPGGLDPYLYWLVGSQNYKKQVLASQTSSTELRHIRWNGDGWGGAPVGDWTGYIVYDPSDSLPLTTTDTPPQKVRGIPCEVVTVRRLEKGWYSVVTDMNQFWDSNHPDC